MQMENNAVVKRHQSILYVLKQQSTRYIDKVKKQDI